MATCDIDIELDRDDPVYTPDETVTGRVVVEVGEDLECRELRLEREWRAHGYGDTASRPEQVETLFSGQWRAGQTLEYPFEVELPPGPCTYHGEHLNVDWRLRAEADVGALFDPEAEASLTLEPGGSEEYVVGDGDVASLRDGRRSDDDTVSWIMFLLGVGAVGIGVYVPVAYALEGRPVPLWGQLGFLAWDGFAIWLIYRSVRNYFAEKRLGDIDVDLSSFEVAPGEEIECRVRLPADADARVDGVSCELKGREEVVAGSGDNKSEKHHVVHSETAVPDGAEDLDLSEAGATELVAGLRIPESAPFTIQAPDKKLVWVVEVRIDLPLWPDWVHEEPLVVRPDPAAG